MSSHCITMEKKLYHRGQIDVIDMPIQLTCNYKYFLVYEDQISRFVVLKGLHGNTANEVAIKLLDILTIIGAPQVLQSNNGRKFAEEVVQELRLLWKDFMILHGEIIETNERNRDFKSLLECWIKENPTKTWYEALVHIQIFQNSTFRCENGKIPYDILFGKNVHDEFQKQSNIINLKNNIWTEEEWVDLLSDKQNDVKKEKKQQLIEDSAFTNIKNIKTAEECESEDSCNEARDELQMNTPDFNFVNVKSEPLNMHTEDSIFEDELGIDNRTNIENQINLKCKICQKQYMKPGHLKNHMRTHIKGKKFEFSVETEKIEIHKMK
ncbi:zinc finger protein 85 [Apis mellifera caucasica]|nr:zinc finger protein 85 [Apis mellifera caucasica]KAG9435875.1 zinc finger protein 85 [Apis mellifera carnica]